MARLVAIAVVAVVAALCAAPASAFNIDFDPDTIPRIPCGSPGATRDVWCGTWLTDQPTGPMWTFGPMGVLELQRISEADARAREGTQFGDFNYTVRCFDGALFYAGTYNGPAGRVMACTNGSVLKGFYRSQSLENTGPGSGLRSGEFEITHSLGGEGASDFTGTITQHFVGTTNWKGHCASSSCTATGTGAPVVPPGAPAGQPPIIGPPLFRIVNISSSPTHRSGVDGVVRTPKIGWLIGAKDRLTATGSVRINGAASIELEALPSGAVFEIRGSAVQDSEGNPIATPAVFEAAGVPVLRQGEATVTASGPRTQARTTAIAGAVLLTPVARVDVSGGVAHVAHNPRSRVTTVGNERGSVSVAPTNPALRSRRLVPGKQVQVTGKAIGRPFDLVPNLQTTIPSPREIRAGPAIVTASWRLSLRSLKRSRCVAVAVSSARPARVLVTIFSGRRSVRLFGQRLVVFTAAARKSTCIKVPAHARTFNVRTPLRLAVGYALGARPRRGERATQPVIKPIQLVP